MAVSPLRRLPEPFLATYIVTGANRLSDSKDVSKQPKVSRGVLVPYAKSLVFDLFKCIVGTFVFRLSNVFISNMLTPEPESICTGILTLPILTCVSNCGLVHFLLFKVLFAAFIL